MMEEMNSVFERLHGVLEKVNVNAVYGEPQTIEGRTLIPVATVTYGMGLGFGSGPAQSECACGCHDEDSAESCCDCESGEQAAECDCECHDAESENAMGGGGGAGGRARPVAYIEVDSEGAHIKPVMDEQKIALAGILLGFWSVGWAGLVLKTLFTRRR